jgi:site-specific recombinase XerD
VDKDDPIAERVSPAKVSELTKILNKNCEKYKRDCATIEKSTRPRLVLTDDSKVVDQAVQALEDYTKRRKGLLSKNMKASQSLPCLNACRFSAF